MKDDNIVNEPENPDLTDMVACHKHGILYPRAAYCPKCDAEVKHGMNEIRDNAVMLGEIRNRLDRLIELVERML